MKDDDHQKETGILATEAAVNSIVVVEAFKLVSQRGRPSEGNTQAKFYSSNSVVNSSFPSAHAMLTWSIASVVAHEYPGPLTQIFAYGLATGVSVARVTGRDHFTSDVVVGSAMGWLIGRQVYAAHHNPELPGGDFGTFYPARQGEGTGRR
jgi:membrane-associated phospholipid phosphatase